MKVATLLVERLRSHRLTAPARTVADAASHMLAIQSQDFVAGRWALAARTSGSPSLRDIDHAFDRGELVRGWTMRGTLHIIPARDLGWVLEVTAERQRQQAAARHRDLGIDDDLVDAAVRALTPALHDGGCTRAEIFETLEKIGIDPRGQRGNHLLFTLTISGIICQGPLVPRSGIVREQRFVLVSDHIQEHTQPADPLAELFVRYIDGHGPAGAADFAWWSGLTLGQAREAAARAATRVDEVEDGLFVSLVHPRRAAGAVPVHALGAFDEYFISYADRTAVCASEHLATVGPAKNGLVRPILIEQGRVIGTWSHAAAAREAPPSFFFPPADPIAVDAALARFSDVAGK